MKIKHFAIAVFFGSSSLIALPPPVPAGGVIEREIEREYQAMPIAPDREIPPIQIDIPEDTLDIPDGETIYVDKIVLQGMESISAIGFCDCVQIFEHRDLTIKNIYELCLMIEQRYAEQGYILARVYPPEQTIEDQTLVLEILEGRLGNVIVEGNCYFHTAFIESYFSCLQGKPLCYDRFLRQLMLLNDNHDLVAGAIFEKGEEVGYADVIIRVADIRPMHLYLNANNYGRNLTRSYRVGGRFDIGNVFRQGDLFSVAEVVGFPFSSLYFTDLRYGLPLNRCGTSLEAGYLFSRFKVDELESLDIKGSSHIANLTLNQALTRTRSTSIDAFTYFDYKQIRNFANNDITSFDKLRVLTFGALVDHFVPCFGRDYLLVRFGVGIPNFLGGLSPIDDESSRLGGGGRFYKFNIDYDRLQYLPWDCFFYFHASGQLSPNKLTLPEQIYIGGSDTVRGFPLAVALGDSGYYLNSEFRIPPPFIADKRFFNSNMRWGDVLQFTAFLDHGGVFLQSINTTFLWGTGVGIRVNGPYCTFLSLDVGFPLNHQDLSHQAFIYLRITSQPF